MKVNDAVYSPLQSDKPVHVHQGGTSSGKTYGILQHLFKAGAENNNEIITVVAEDVPNLKSGAYRDADSILSSDQDLREWWPRKKENKTNRTYTCLSGSIIEFKSFQDEYDARSGKRDRLFINEANAVKFGIYEQLNMRTSKQAIIDFNPSARFWAHDKLFGRDDVEWTVTTFKDNAFLDEKVRDKILSYEPTPENIEKGTANEYRWKVYGLGEVGRLEGLVFPDFKVTMDWPEEYKWRVIGLDFGFTNDPTALVEIRYAHGDLYWKQHIYETGMTNPEIARCIKGFEFGRNTRIIADSAEPKSIEEIRRRGVNIKGAEKGRDSINQGIDAIKRYKIHVHTSSKDLIEEFSSYIWKEDKDGNSTNKPIDKFNHGIDAGRYALTKQLLNPPYDLSATMVRI